MNAAIFNDWLLGLNEKNSNDDDKKPIFSSMQSYIQQNIKMSDSPT
jgi:hypothetical protein